MTETYMDGTKPLSTPEPNIEHIVISGGGALALNFYGALKQSNKMGIWQHKNIKAYYGTSAGAIMAVMIALKCDWDTLDNYLINRPWEKVVKFDILELPFYYNRNGLLDMQFFIDFYKPIFSANDIDININFADFKQVTGVDLFIYATTFHTLEISEFSATATPNVRVLDAVYVSSSLPILFVPMKIDDVVYMDGFLYLDYPIVKCLEKGHDPTTVLGIKKSIALKPYVYDESMNMFEYLMQLVNSGFTKTQLTHYPGIESVKEIIVTSNPGDMSKIFDLATSREYRVDFIQRGVDDVNTYLSTVS